MTNFGKCHDVACQKLGALNPYCQCGCRQMSVPGTVEVVPLDHL